MPRKSKPWAVIVSTPTGPTRTEHSSEAKAYEQVRIERAAIADGTSRAYGIRVEQWEPDSNRWAWFDQIDPYEN